MMDDDATNRDLIVASQITALSLLVGGLIGVMREAGMMHAGTIEGLFDQVRQKANGPELSWISRDQYSNVLLTI